MKKRLIMLGLGLAVVGTGMVINKLRKRNNEEELNEVEEIIENEVEEIVVDNEEEIAIDKENNEEEFMENDKEEKRINILKKLPKYILEAIIAILAMPIIAIKEIIVTILFILLLVFDKNFKERLLED
jgi:hypothetical protein